MNITPMRGADLVNCMQWARHSFFEMMQGTAQYSEQENLVPDNVNASIEILESLMGEMTDKEIESARLYSPLTKSLFILGYASAFGLLTENQFERAVVARERADANIQRIFSVWINATRTRLPQWSKAWSALAENSKEGMGVVGGDEDGPPDNPFGFDPNVYEALAAGWYFTMHLQDGAAHDERDDEDAKRPEQSIQTDAAKARAIFDAMLTTEESRNKRVDDIKSIIECHRQENAPCLISASSLKMLSECFDTYVSLVTSGGSTARDEEVVYSPSEVAALVGMNKKGFVAKVAAGRMPQAEVVVYQADENAPTLWHYSLLQVAAIVHGFGEQMAKEDLTLSWYCLLLQYAIAGKDPRTMFA